MVNVVNKGLKVEILPNKSMEHRINQNIGNSRFFLRRLHPRKSWKWIVKKYFPYYGGGKSNNRWILTGPKDKNRLLNFPVV